MRADTQAQRDPRIDNYIQTAAPFARPLLETMRERIHAACPQVEETMKWGMPTFCCRGRVLAGMGAFKAHATLWFWMGEAVTQTRTDGAMGQFGRMRTLEDLPDADSMRGMIDRAVALIEAGAPRTPRRATRPMPAVPPELSAALADDPRAAAAFHAFSPSRRRDYIEWIAGAVRADTRARRVAQAVSWIAEGKPRDWKHAAR